MNPTRKLIEVAIPLDAINAACKADKDRKTGTIRNLHKWFAPMPLPAWRGLLFAALVDEPVDEAERDRLMGLMERLVENGGDVPEAAVVAEARREIERCWPDGTPTIVDPFCGAGSTLVEAQRLGCQTAGSDLNPVPVVITKVLTELLPRVAGLPSVAPDRPALETLDAPFDGFVADVIHYGDVVRTRARRRLEGCFSEEPDATTLVWLWCRTVRCPNPACGCSVPLIDSTVISRASEEQWHVDVSYPRGSTEPRFEVRKGADAALPGTVTRTGATCIACGSPVPFTHIRSLGQAGQLRMRAMAKVQKIDGGRRFVAIDDAEEAAVLSVRFPDDGVDVPLVGKAVQNVALYGITTQRDLFTARQALVLSVFADEVARLPEKLRSDGASSEYAAAIGAVLGLCIGKLTQAMSTLVRWNVRNGATAKAEPAFARHDMPMSWDFAETNPFGGSVGDWTQIVRTAVRALHFVAPGRGTARQGDARTALRREADVLIATDPPYFDQIGYADLSDYFYVWLRRALRGVFPDLFETVATPKAEELVALASRHGGDRTEARRYFVDGFTDVFRSAGEVQVADAPMLVVYAFKEQGSALGGDIAPGWEAILEALVSAGMSVTATWPIRGARLARMVGINSNSLATYVVLACRPRPKSAGRISRLDLARFLRTELMGSVHELQRANIAPVDLAQAVIGPGMQIYTRHASVVETDGSRVGVASALALINRTLAELLDEQEGDLDPDTRWAVTWYEQYGFSKGPFGEADQLARSKGIAVDSLVRAGIVDSGASKVALIPRDSLEDQWDPAKDVRATVWEAVQYLARALAHGGEIAGAELYGRLASLRDPARELAYRLFQIAERAGRTEEAMVYNGLVASWSEIARLAASLPDEPGTASAPEGLF